eukprot:3844643-Amphidinium_carterae.1
MPASFQSSSRGARIWSWMSPAVRDGGDTRKKEALGLRISKEHNRLVVLFGHLSRPCCRSSHLKVPLWHPRTNTQRKGFARPVLFDASAQRTSDFEVHSPISPR